MALSKKLMTGGLAALALMATAGSAFAAPAYATSNVNVRSGPGTGYAQVDVLRRGDRVDVQQCRGSWCYVEKRGPDGWVSASYLDRGRGGGWDDRPSRPDWDRPGWDNGPGWDRPPHWNNPRPPRPPHWDPRPPRPWPGYGYGNGNSSSVCVDGPNGYFCVGD